MKVLKKEQNPWKKSQRIRKGVTKINHVSSGVKRSLRASNIGENEQEEKSGNQPVSGTDSFSYLEKQILNKKKAKQQAVSGIENNRFQKESGRTGSETNSFEEHSHRDSGTGSFQDHSHRDSGTTNFQNPPGKNLRTSSSQNHFLKDEILTYPRIQEPRANISTRKSVSNRRTIQTRTLSKNSNSKKKSNPYGWGSSNAGRTKGTSIWESTKSGTAQIGSSSQGNIIGSSGSSSASVFSQTAGTTSSGAVGGTASSAAGGVASSAAGGAVGVGVGLALTVFQKGREHIQESLHQRKIEKMEKQQEKNSNGIAGAFGTVLIFLVSLIICICAVMFFSFSDQENSIVEVAKAEVEVWEENVGGYKYKDWYGIDANWCAMFVSWCSDQCGYIDDEIMPKTGSVNSMSWWYKERDQYQSKASGYEPKPGDIIFFQEGASHTGIVVEYDAETKTITTIEGNTGSSSTEPYHKGSRVKEKKYPLTYRKISGYGLPDYPQEGLQIENIEVAAVLPKKYAA